jgi:hypothetical protein
MKKTFLSGRDFLLSCLFHRDDAPTTGLAFGTLFPAAGRLG